MSLSPVIIMMTFRTERYKVLVDYPASRYKAGDVIVRDNDVPDKQDPRNFPNVFQKLKWWECMETDFNALFTIKFCKIVRTHGYWRNGDILPVSGYVTDTDRRNPVFVGFFLKGYSGPEKYELDRVEPATEEEFLAWKKENKISITP